MGTEAQRREGGRPRRWTSCQQPMTGIRNVRAASPRAVSCVASVNGVWVRSPPDECGGEVNGVERAKRSGKRVAGPAEDRCTEQHEVDRLNPVTNRGQAVGRLVRRQHAGARESVDGPTRLDLDQLAGHQPLGTAQLRQCSRFAKDEPQHGRRVDVDGHRFERSSSSTARLDVPGGRTGFPRGRLRGVRLAGRISSVSAWMGTISAMGVFRSTTVIRRPLRTERRCSLKRALRSATPTRVMTDHSHDWS